MVESGLPSGLIERLAAELEALPLRAPEPRQARYRLESRSTHHGLALAPVVMAGAAVAVLALFVVSPQHAPQNLAVQVVSNLDKALSADQASPRPATLQPANLTLSPDSLAGRQGASNEGQMGQPGVGAGQSGIEAGPTDPNAEQPGPDMGQAADTGRSGQ
jgi:hypothetical protein